MKRYISLALAGLMIFNISALALTPSLENFKAVNTYETGTFSDVDENAWYAESIVNAYELGLLNGVLDGKFGVDTNITIAHSLAIACRLHSIYNGGKGEFLQGDVWYQVYVDYAISNNIISGRQFSDYNKTATRSEFAGILYSSIGQDGLTAINNVTSIPDLSVGMTNYYPVLALYNAGVLTGNDEYGTFTPDAYITRAEVSAIVSRMADTNERKSFVLTEANQPFVDIDTTFLNLEIGQSQAMKYTANQVSGTAVWSSSNLGVCHVSETGVITGITTGTCMITVNVNGYKDSFTVSVTMPSGGISDAAYDTLMGIMLNTDYYGDIFQDPTGNYYDILEELLGENFMFI